MNKYALAALLSGMSVSQLYADNLIWSDNFDVADSGSFDAASLDGRFGGQFPEDLVGRSSRVQQQILAMQLRMGGGRVRFEVPPGGDPIQNYDFATGSAGAEILSGGGLRVEFDYLPTDGTSDTWIAFSIGFPSFQQVPEPGGFRLNEGNTDFGFLLRNNGGSQFFKNGVGADGGSFTATTGSRHVVIEYGFTGLADFDTFTTVVSVDGTEVINESYSWSNNSGQLMIELECLQDGTLFDNLQFFELTPARLSVDIDDASFLSSDVQGNQVGNLEALLGGLPGGATYQLVSGDGDADNGKFQINGSALEVGAFDFTGANSTDGQQFSVRVRGTSNGAGAETVDEVLLLTIVKDDDADGILDQWEIDKAGNITDLNGNASGPGPGSATGDFDGDGLTDTDEYEIFLGTSGIYGQYVDIDPTEADSDGDGLDDREELEPGYELATNFRPQTDPTLADTDSDGLSDLVETNDFSYDGPSDTGTDPVFADTDLDGLEDGFEVENAPPYDPTVDNSFDDFDGDGLNTFDEVFYGSSVLLVDTDSDNLDDFEEVFPSSSRPATNPAEPDTDFDGLTDEQETNTGFFGGVNDQGTDPTFQDWDGDGARDGYEVASGTDPFDAASIPAVPAGFSVVQITTDASSGISTSKTYTHKVSGGGAASVNGVDFDILTGGVTPANFIWDTNNSNNERNSLGPITNGDWDPVSGGVTEEGLQGLLGGFTYTGVGEGSSQVFTLSGLTPGQDYEFRVYIRLWGRASPRNIDLTFTNGGQIETPFMALLEDRPDILLGNTNDNSAYYLSFAYTAESTELEVEAMIPMGADTSTDSFHMYGMTNEVVGAVAADLPVVTNVSRNGSGQIVIDFLGLPSVGYNVTKSSDLQSAFVPLSTPLSITTDAGGVGQAIIPTSESSETSEFYRIEDQ